MSSFTPLRWGIFGCGKISYDFCVALSSLPKEEHVIEFVSAQSLERAKDFAAQFGVEKYSDKYADVAADKDVDVCYVGTINTTHKDLSIMAMNHGKAVLCEKPVTLCSNDLEDIIRVAKEKNVFFMEAVWTRCFPLYLDIQSKLKSGYYGEPNVLMGTFGVENLFQIERIHTPGLGGGVLIDIGVYLVTVTDMIFAGHNIKDVKICSHVEENGLDRSGTITFLFEGNKIASLLYSGDEHLPCEVNVLCSKGKFSIPEPFHCPLSYSEEMNGATSPQEFDFSLPLPPKEMIFPNSMGLKFEAEHLRECLISGKKESPIIPHETSQRIIALLDNLKDQIKKSLK